MEYVSGGDLMLHIQKKQFSLRQAKFYGQEVLLALEYFHANGIIYRYVIESDRACKCKQQLTGHTQRPEA